MRLLGSSSPMQLAGWSGVGCLFILAAEEIDDSRILSRELQTLSRGQQGLLFLLLTALGLVVMWIAGERLEDGIRNERWPEEKVDGFRRFMAHPIFFAFPFLMLASMIVSSVVSKSFHTPAEFWPLLWANMNVQRLQRAVRPSPPVSGGGRWFDAAPAQSAHWGEGRVASDESVLG